MRASDTSSSYSLRMIGWSRFVISATRLTLDARYRSNFRARRGRVNGERMPTRASANDYIISRNKPMMIDPIARPQRKFLIEVMVNLGTRIA